MKYLQLIRKRENVFKKISFKRQTSPVLTCPRSTDLQTEAPVPHRHSSRRSDIQADNHIDIQADDHTDIQTYEDIHLWLQKTVNRLPKDFQLSSLDVQTLSRAARILSWPYNIINYYQHLLFIIAILFLYLHDNLITIIFNTIII